MSPEKSVRRKLHELRREARDMSKNERPFWGVYGSDIRDYEDSFKGVLNGATFAEIIKHRQEQHLPVNVLELMGDGQALTDLDIDNGLAVTLSDLRGFQRKRQDQKTSLHVLPGDILSKKTWQAMQEWLDTNTVNSNFDLILMRPVGGWSMIPNDPRMHYYLINRLYKMLSPNDGAMYIEINMLPLGYDKVIESWLTEVGNTPGIDCEHDRGQAFRLTRGSAAPKDLPILPSYSLDHQSDPGATESRLAE